MLIAGRAKAKLKRRYPASRSDRKPARVFLASHNRPAHVVARCLTARDLALDEIPPVVLATSSDEAR
jgi:hypothetical protein